MGVGMFDQNDQNQQATTTAPMPAADTGVPPLPADPIAPVASDVSAPTNDQPFNMTPVASDTPAPTADPVAPAASDSMFSMSTPAPASDATDASAPAPTVDDTASLGNNLPDLSALSAPSSPAPAGDGDLLSIKQDALQSLSPLLGKLEQSPEEKFRTTMMLIQASDDQSLIQTAYAAAKEISDEKVRAQALLDIVNEINYFTQAKSAS